MVLSSQAPLPSTAVLFSSCQQSTWLPHQLHHHSTVMVSLPGWDPLSWHHCFWHVPCKEELNKEVGGTFSGLGMVDNLMQNECIAPNEPASRQVLVIQQSQCQVPRQGGQPWLRAGS